MNRNKIIVVSLCYARHSNRLFKKLYEKAEQHSNLHLLIVDNTNGKDNDLPGLINIYDNVSLIFSSGEDRQRSISHSIALDKGLKFGDSEELQSVHQKEKKYGHKEIIIGNWLKKANKREKVILA